MSYRTKEIAILLSLLLAAGAGARQVAPADPPGLPDDPASPALWSDRGDALLDEGRTGDAWLCYERALALAPNQVPNLSRAARFFERIGRREEALRASARILALGSSYSPAILRGYTSSSYDLQDTLDYGLPDPAEGGTRVHHDYFRLLLHLSSRENIQKAWEHLDAKKLTDPALTARYLDYLLGRKLYDDALALRRAGAYLRTEFIANGGFESDPDGSPFDWRLRPVAGAAAAIVPLDGKRALRVEFDGTANLAYRHASQDTLTPPGRYRFSARMQSEGLTTNRGVGLRIYDPDGARNLDLSTEEFSGTRPWSALSRTLVVPAATRRVRVEVFRSPSEQFDNKIAGRVWIDDVTLTLLP
ncbi:MAG: hypothetical protein JXP48_09755 [Acidobacteria bacterium]|nr:hypothetical protein [Acidobacteriota bacterium]